jgi:hypothetical protein
MEKLEKMGVCGSRCVWQRAGVGVEVKGLHRANGNEEVTFVETERGK